MITQWLWFALVKENLFVYSLTLLALYWTVYSKRTFSAYARRKLGPAKLKFWNIVAKAMFGACFAVLIWWSVVPLTIDSVELIAKGVSWKNTEYLRDEVSATRSFIIWNLNQSIVFKGNKSKNYGLSLSGTKVWEDEVYEIRYLPRSRAVLAIRRMNQRNAQRRQPSD